jgi:hypothetical protein
MTHEEEKLWDTKAKEELERLKKEFDDIDSFELSVDGSKE